MSPKPAVRSGVVPSLQSMRSMPAEFRFTGSPIAAGSDRGVSSVVIPENAEEVSEGIQESGGNVNPVNDDSPYCKKSISVEDRPSERDESLDAVTSPSTFLPSQTESRWGDTSFYASKKKKLQSWCQLPDGNWALGKIVSTTATESILSLPEGKVIKAKPECLVHANPDILDGVDNLMQLSYLNEPSVLYNLQYRYNQDLIYTKAGPVLVAVNPFKVVPLYGNDYIDAYRRKTIESPHVYAITDTAIKEMIRDEVNQSIIISGESGAGKTETAKIAMQYLATLGGGSGIEYEILKTNPILEAFGNAKTLRNDNSSRFGKLIEIHFSETGKISGAKIQTFLLEKSRVVQCAEGERSYHIFYQLCAGVPPALRETLKLKNANEYKYLKQSSCYSIAGVDDAERFHTVMEALDIVHVSKEDQNSVFAMLAAVLWLGNISFTVVDNENHVEAMGDEAVVTGVSALPWLIKPLYGFISDSVPLFGYRRRSYLVLSGLLGALSWTLMATLVDSKYGAAFCILLGSLSVAFSDVVVDSMVVERARGESQSTSGSLQSLCWGSSAFGGIVSAYFSGSLVEAYGVRFVFGVTALLPLITSAVAVLVKEQPTLGSTRGHNHLAGQGFIETSKQNLIQLLKAIKQPTVFLPTLFIFCWQATPHSDSAMFYFTTNQLGFTPEFLGRVKLVTSVASLLGVGLYNGFLKNVPLRKIFLATTIIGSALGMTQVFLVTGLNHQFGISDQWFAVGDSLIITVLGQASFMPVLVLAARLCPEGMEATLFATLMSISNGGGVLGGLMGAGLTQLFGVTRDSFDNLAWLIVVCNLSSFLPLPLLGLLPKENSNGATKSL